MLPSHVELLILLVADGAMSSADPYSGTNVFVRCSLTVRRLIHAEKPRIHAYCPWHADCECHRVFVTERPLQ